MPDPTSTTTREQATGKTDWALPLLALVPAAALSVFTELSTPWLITSWAFVALSAVLVIAGWTTTIRRGTNGVRAWPTCLLTHTVLVAQVLLLVRG